MVKASVPLSGQLIGFALLASVFASACSGGGDPPAQGQGMPPALVELQAVETTTVRESSEFVGALEAQERVALSPETEGRVVQIYASSGQAVDRGTPIIALKSDRTEAEVSGASADVAAATAAVNTARQRLQAAEAERARAEADVRLQTTEYERTRRLVEAGAQARQELDRVTNSRDTAIAALQAATENVDAAQAELNQAEAQLARAQADRAVASTNLEDTQVVAPIAGVVGDIEVKVGDYVTPQDVLTSIIQNDALELNIAIPLERTNQLRVGLPVELLDAQGELLTRGEISFVSPEVNTADQAVLAKASFPNQDNRLKDGQFVRARIVWQSAPGILVPTVAVTRIAGQPFVYVAEPGEPSESGEPQMIARQRPVELGEIQGNSYQVRSGIEPGDQVITSGILNLSDGAPVMVGQPDQPAS